MKQSAAEESLLLINNKKAEVLENKDQSAKGMAELTGKTPEIPVKSKPDEPLPKPANTKKYKTDFALWY